MNSDPHDIGNDAAEREWQDQELALRQERLGVSPDEENARVRRYRMLTRALLQPLAQTLPANFARDVARHAEIRAETRRASGGRFELILSAACVSVFGLALGIVVTIHGSHWLYPVAMTARTLTNPWVLALLGCAGTFLALEQWRSHARA